MSETQTAKNQPRNADDSKPMGQLAAAIPTPMSLIQLAVAQGADIDKLEKLMELQMRWEANAAKKAFVVAMNAFKENPPEIIKNRKASFDGRGGNIAYEYATLDQVCAEVTHGLSAHGISHRWRVEQSNKETLRVTCVLTHEQGHSEETTLEGSPDNSGSKNSIQAIGSAITYLERYSLLAATGLAVKGTDNDGRGAEIAEYRLHLEDIRACQGPDELEKTYRAAFREAAANKKFDAMQEIVKAKDERRKQLMGPA